MIASFNAELLKLRKRWATWVIFILYIVFVAAFVYGIQLLGVKTAPPDMPNQVVQLLKDNLLPKNAPYQTTGFLVSLGGAIALIFGVLATGSEYSWNTVKTTLTQRPGRLPMFFGKVAAVGVWIIIYVIVSFIAALIASNVTSAMVGQSTGFPDVSNLLKGLGASLLILGAWTAFGTVLATFFRGNAWAIGLGLIYALILENLVAGLSNLVSWLQDILDYLLVHNASALADAINLQPAANQNGPFGGQAQSSIGTTHGLIVLFGWLIIALVIAALLYRQRDVA